MALGPGPGSDILRVGWRGIRTLIGANPTWRTHSWSQIRQKGSIITETVVVLPILLATIIGMLSLMMQISDYMYLSQSAREVGLVLSRVPFMYQVNQSAVGSTAPTPYSFDVNPTSVPTNLKSEVASCLANGLAGTSLPCTAVGCCAQRVAQWYTYEHLKGRSLNVKWPMTAKVSYRVRDSSDTTSGLCFIEVQLIAQTNDMLPSFGSVGGDITIDTFVPYVSKPVNFNAGTCR